MHMCLYLISNPISIANTLLTNAEVIIKKKNKAVSMPEQLFLRRRICPLP